MITPLGFSFCCLFSVSAFWSIVLFKFLVSGLFLFFSWSSFLHFDSFHIFSFPCFFKFIKFSCFSVSCQTGGGNVFGYSTMTEVEAFVVQGMFYTSV